MRLWHQALIPHLPQKQLLGQHRECCALRGNGWGKKHSVVDYVFTHSPELLVAYHKLIMKEMQNRGYQTEKLWWDDCYRGKNCLPLKSFDMEIYYDCLSKLSIYPEHNNDYLKECLENLKTKGIQINLIK